MFCGKCGTILENGVCPLCDAPTLPAPTPKKNNTWIVVVIAVVVALAIGVAAGWFFFGEDISKEESFQSADEREDKADKEDKEDEEEEPADHEENPIDDEQEPVDLPSEDGAEKAQPMPGRTYFKSTQLPELSSEGVKGTLKEVYYTVDGGLAVTLSLSNGMSTEQELVKLGITIFNDESGNIAKYTLDTFKPVCRIKAGGRAEYYFEIGKQYVTVTDDPLKVLAATLEIGSIAVDSEPVKDGEGPKDIASNRTYFENVDNIPILSAEGVRASIIRAQYTNDGSLALTMVFSNGTNAKKTVSMVDLLIANGEGTTIADYTFDSFDEPIEIEAQSYKEYLLFVESAYVPVKDDSLTSLAMTISVSAG